MLRRFQAMQRTHTHLIYNIYAVNGPVYSVTLKIYGNKGKLPLNNNNKRWCRWRRRGREKWNETGMNELKQDWKFRLQCCLCHFSPSLLMSLSPVNYRFISINDTPQEINENVIQHLNQRVQYLYLWQIFSCTLPLYLVWYIGIVFGGWAE